MTLVMIYSAINIQVTASEREPTEKQDTHRAEASVQNDDTSLKKCAIKFYAQNYRVINFWTIAVPITACSFYGMYSAGTYIYDSYQQAVARNNELIEYYNQQREEYYNRCMSLAKGCNGTWIPLNTESCLESSCVYTMMECMQRQCTGIWSMLMCPNSDTMMSQILINTDSCSYG